jgi:hypothetical protein
MRSIFRRPRRPSPEEIISAALLRRDFRTAAPFILAGAAEVLVEARDTLRAASPNTATLRERTLRLALERITTG